MVDPSAQNSGGKIGNISNHHCSCVCINGAGILIEGESGSGKTCMALGLLDAAARYNIRAEFVCDDQALLENCDGQLKASAPREIAGKIELYGYGIVNIDHIETAFISLVCELVADNLIERLPEPKVAERKEVKLPFLQVPCKHEAQAVRLIFAQLGLPIWRAG